MPLIGNGEVIVLDALLAGRFLSLHTGEPPASEIAGGGYARQAVTFNQTFGPNPTVYGNSELIQFPAATSDWGIISHFGIWTAESGGELLAYNVITVPKPIEADDVARWHIHSLLVDAD